MRSGFILKFLYRIYSSSKQPRECNVVNPLVSPSLYVVGPVPIKINSCIISDSLSTWVRFIACPNSCSNTRPNVSFLLEKPFAKSYSPTLTRIDPANISLVTGLVTAPPRARYFFKIGTVSFEEKA